jgi:hypothetical protein
MAATRPNSIETARRGRELYEREISSHVENDPANKGKLLALDVDSGDYSLAATSLDAVRALKARRPNARAHLIRVGSPTAVRIGAGLRLATMESRE